MSGSKIIDISCAKTSLKIKCWCIMKSAKVQFKTDKILKSICDLLGSK